MLFATRMIYLDSILLILSYLVKRREADTERFLNAGQYKKYNRRVAKKFNK